MALGLVSVKTLPPTVVAPRFVRAFAAVAAPVPPFATATVPVTFAAFNANDAVISDSWLICAELDTTFWGNSVVICNELVTTPPPNAVVGILPLCII